MKQVDTLQGLFYVHDQDQVGAVIAGRQFWDWQIQPAVEKALAVYGPTRAAIDLGAAFGWFTVYLAKRFTHVYAVEMHPQTCRLLRINVNAHQLLNVTIIEQAAYSVDCMLDLATTAEIGFPVPDNLDETPNPCSIAVMPRTGGIQAGPIDDWIMPASIGFIKSDVQGCDLHALRGLRKTIARDRPVIAFEWEAEPARWHGAEWQRDVLPFWEALGYELSPLHTSIDWLATPKELLK